jgi:hypothetical protein
MKRVLNLIFWVKYPCELFATLEVVVVIDNGIKASVKAKASILKWKATNRS